MAADKPVTKTYPHRLSTQDIAELAAVVCTSKGAQHRESKAWTDQPRDLNNIQASVECEPHLTSTQYATYYKADCQRGEKWQCLREKWLRTTLDSRQVDIATNGYNSEMAYSLVSKISRYRNIKGEVVFEPDTQQCALSKGPSKELLDITCDGKLFRLSYWCPQSSCPRVFSINGYFVPANGGGL